MDWEKISTLLHITETARQWPRLQHLHDAAMRELEGMKEPEPTGVVGKASDTPISRRKIEEPADE